MKYLVLAILSIALFVQSNEEECLYGYYWEYHEGYTCGGSFSSAGQIGFEECTETCSNDNTCKAIEWENGGQGCEIVSTNECDTGSAHAPYHVRIKGDVCTEAAPTLTIPREGLNIRMEARFQSGNTVRDSVSGVLMGTHSIGSENNGKIKFWNENEFPMQRNGGPGIRIGQRYTHVYWVKWRNNNNDGWRTLIRATEDHCAIVETNASRLGMFSNRNGKFRPAVPTYNIVKNKWRLLIVTAEGSSSTSSTGTSKFYIGGIDDESLRHVGDADRVCSGKDWYRIGLDGQRPGKVGMVLQYNRILSMGEMESIREATMADYGGIPTTLWLHRGVGRCPVMKNIGHESSEHGTLALCRDYCEAFYESYFSMWEEGSSTMCGCYSDCDELETDLVDAQSYEILSITVRKELRSKNDEKSELEVAKETCNTNLNEMTDSRNLWKNRFEKVQELDAAFVDHSQIAMNEYPDEAAIGTSNSNCNNPTPAPLWLHRGVGRCPANKNIAHESSHHETLELCRDYCEYYYESYFSMWEEGSTTMCGCYSDCDELETGSVNAQSYEILSITVREEISRISEEICNLEVAIDNCNTNLNEMTDSRNLWKNRFEEVQELDAAFVAHSQLAMNKYPDEAAIGTSNTNCNNGPTSGLMEKAVYMAIGAGMFAFLNKLMVSKNTGDNYTEMNMLEI